MNSEEIQKAILDLHLECFLFDIDKLELNIDHNNENHEKLFVEVTAVTGMLAQVGVDFDFDEVTYSIKLVI